MKIKLQCLCANDGIAHSFVVDRMKELGYEIDETDKYSRHDHVGIKEVDSLLEAHLEENKLRNICGIKLLETSIRVLDR